MQLAKYSIILFILCGILIPEIVARSLEKKQPRGSVARTGEGEAPAEGAAAPSSKPEHIKRGGGGLPEMPMDLNTMHAPCDMDTRGRQSYIFAFPNHCIWAFNNRYMSEGHFRIYKTYQLEGFFFGQYYERLKRYEFEPHSYDYNM
ncbi:uncharacterized protein LOC117136872 [Drosophila mauritiana]|uniref:Uncharacterized protein LOC117136872 n=1 Tax=Drosophila mauritiana TaxID=7226 RepID=A0A6P8JE99_DROMA|nr:uncharacterized protein LOC117136872 [Drosophila mauritiana]